MPQDEQQDIGGIRRIGRKDRKKSLPASEPVFPVEDKANSDPFASSQDSLGIDIPPDLTALFDDDSLPDTAAEEPPTLQFPDRGSPPPAPQSSLKQRPVTPTAKRRRHRKAAQYNIIALLFLIATGMMIVYFSMVWRDPFNASINPLAPPTPFVLVTWTPEAETESMTAADTIDDSPTPVSVDAAPSATLQPGDPPFQLAESGVQHRANTGNDRGCDWASITGQVIGLAGEPLDGLAIQIVDAEDPQGLDVRVFSGAAVSQGPGGFELVLGGVPQAGRFHVQLFSTAGAPLSDVFEVETRDSCDENVTVVNFVQQRGL